VNVLIEAGGFYSRKYGKQQLCNVMGMVDTCQTARRSVVVVWLYVHVLEDCERKFVRLS